MIYGGVNGSSQGGKSRGRHAGGGRAGEGSLTGGDQPRGEVPRGDEERTSRSSAVLSPVRHRDARRELASLDVGEVLRRKEIEAEFRLGTEDTKYCKARTIFLESRKARNALLAYLRRRRPDLDFAGTEPLFVGQKLNHRDGTRRLSANTIVQTFAKMYERAGVVGASSHSGRRWFMTELARCGVHPRVIQKRAGHSSLATTQRYIEVTPDQERQAVRAIQF